MALFIKFFVISSFFCAIVFSALKIIFPLAIILLIVNNNLIKRSSIIISMVAGLCVLSSAFLTPQQAPAYAIQFWSCVTALSLIFYSNYSRNQLVWWEDTINSLNLYLLLGFITICLAIFSAGVGLRVGWEVVGAATGKSINYFGSFVIIACFFSLAYGRNTLLALICLGLLLISEGRVMQLSVLIIFIFVGLTRFPKVALKLVPISIVMAFSVVYFGGFIDSQGFQEIRFFRKGFSSERIDAWLEYIKAIDSLVELTFGVDFLELGSELFEFGNPHNSIISVHAYGGVGALIFATFFVPFLFVVLGREGFQYTSVLASLWLLRVCFDSIGVFDVYDVFVFGSAFIFTKINKVTSDKFNGSERSYSGSNLVGARR